jgi:hypothetical protein
MMGAVVYTMVVFEESIVDIVKDLRCAEWYDGLEEDKEAFDGIVDYISTFKDDIKDNPKKTGYPIFKLRAVKYIHNRLWKYLDRAM